MNFLPIVLLELRRAARKPATYYARCLAGLVACFTGLAFVFAGFNRIMSTASAGRSAFAVLTVGAYALMAAQAIVLTCDCVSLEKREGTLGLLFLTDLNGFDIVAGKLAARVSRSLYCLMAAFPAFGFCVILGGVGLDDLWLVMLGLLNTALYFSALGLLISACVWRERNAAALGGLALLVPGALLPVLAVMLNSTALVALVPAGTILAAPGLGAGIGSRLDGAGSFLVPHALAWLFLGAASYVVPRAWSRNANAITTGRRAARRHSENPRRELPPWVTEPDKPLLTTGLLAVTSAVILTTVIIVGPGLIAAQAGAVTILLLHGILKYQAASQAVRMLAGRRRSGELELLLTTPYHEDEIVRGCVLELKRSLFWPVLFALGVDLALMVIGWRSSWYGDGPGWAAAVVAEVVWLLVNLYSLSWVGLFLGFRQGSAAKAGIQTIFYVLLLPWLLAICFGALASIFDRGRGIGSEIGVSSAGLFIIALAFCNSLFPGWAINELRDRFRLVATDNRARSWNIRAAS